MPELQSHKQPPFSYAPESTAFQRRWFEEVPKRFHALQIQIIPERNILRYRHGRQWTSIDTQKNEVSGEFKEFGETLLVAADERANGALEKLTVFTDELARKFAAATADMMFQKVEEVTEKTGNIVTWKKKERNAPEAFVELLRKLQFGVTENGEPSLPSFMNVDPAFIAELQKHLVENQSFKDEVEKIKAEKVAEALGREAERKAKFKTFA